MENRKRGQRGPGKKPALAHVSLRIKPETLEFFQGYSTFPTSTMRKVLEQFVKKYNERT
jgi:hypothetical protein